ncbi:hypothetical protein [Anaeromusa sp.]|uniref:phage adaptor protein n=1 Tax=Anaeromusa sp. TaxID=1872520 RepID=UPI00261782A4|nr:hypothetical protein [Anaeromusa sp.]MDD3157022.1 hypothetical protein [Anaeromusa sp.]
MINVGALVYAIRLDLGDQKRLMYSDYDITRSLNHALHVVSMELCNMDSDLAEAEATLTLLDGCAALPDDYQNIIATLDPSENPLTPYPRTQKLDQSGYRISGNKLYATCETVTLAYKRNLPDVAAAADSIDLPAPFYDLLRKMVVSQMNGGQDGMLSTVSQTVIDLASKRKYSRTVRPMPFSV